MKLGLFAALGILAFAGTPHAANHPFVGVYYFGNPEGPNRPAYTLEQEKLNCAFSFAILFENGDFTDLVIDKAEFDRSGKVQFHKWTLGNCQMSADGKHDSCTSAMVPDMTTKYEMGNIYGDLTGERISYRLFESGQAAADSLAKGDANAGAKMNAMRCPFTLEEVKPFLTGKVTDLTEETWSPLINPDTSPATIEALKTVLNAMKIKLP